MKPGHVMPGHTASPRPWTLVGEVRHCAPSSRNNEGEHGRESNCAEWPEVRVRWLDATETHLLPADMRFGESSASVRTSRTRCLAPSWKPVKQWCPVMRPPATRCKTGGR